MEQMPIEILKEMQAAALADVRAASGHVMDGLEARWATSLHVDHYPTGRYCYESKASFHIASTDRDDYVARYEQLLDCQPEVLSSMLMVSKTMVREDGGHHYRVYCYLCMTHPEQYRQALEDCGSLITCETPAKPGVKYQTVQCSI